MIRPTWCLTAAVAAIAGLCVSSGAFAQKSPVGPEFQINVFTNSPQEFPAVASDADGDFVVTWDSAGQDGQGHGVFARRFSSAGDPLDVELQVHTYTTAGSRIPTVATSSAGDFVIVWRDGGGGNYDIHGRRFSSAGSPLASQFQVSTYTQNEQINPVVAANAAGDFIVAWISNPQDGAEGGIFAQRYSSAGTPLGVEFQVNSYTAGYQRNPTVAIVPGNDFVIAWQSDQQDGASFGVFAQRFSSAGGPLAIEFQVNDFTSNYQGNPSAVPGLNGSFVVTWESRYQIGSGYAIFARRFASTGAPLAIEFAVSVRTLSSYRLPAVTTDADGDFVVVWREIYNPNDVFGRRFSSAGFPLTVPFQINTYTTSSQNRPAVAARSDGDFVVVWMSLYQDGNNYGIFGQRFSALPALDVDGNGVVDPLTDGLLVLRFFFGFSGGALAGGAIGTNCTRCDGTTVAFYLANAGLLLDIDGNGSTAPLTDGLLALRFLFGFAGDALVTDAVDGGCSRCTAPLIQPYLVGLTT
jgi:hypothetical protein